MIEIVKVSSEDALLLANMRRLVWLETYRGIYPDSMLDEYDADAYAIRDRRRIEDPSHHYYFFIENGRCAGYFSFGPYNYGNYKDFALCLNNLYILKAYQRRGLGRKAFATINEYCKTHQIQRFFCGCNANNIPAVSFYRHMGGIQGDAYNPDCPKQDQIIHFEFYLGE